MFTLLLLHFCAIPENRQTPLPRDISSLGCIKPVETSSLNFKHDHILFQKTGQLLWEVVFLLQILYSFLSLLFLVPFRGFQSRQSSHQQQSLCVQSVVFATKQGLCPSLIWIFLISSTLLGLFIERKSLIHQHQQIYRSWQRVQYSVMFSRLCLRRSLLSPACGLWQPAQVNSCPGISGLRTPLTGCPLP